ncbi:unnamed protein product [Symbiodinium sp. CCMP2592]|nr:unnamed protein product [Symbiodinium sp. CCMP2592]
MSRVNKGRCIGVVVTGGLRRLTGQAALRGQIVPNGHIHSQTIVSADGHKFLVVNHSDVLQGLSCDQLVKRAKVIEPLVEKTKEVVAYDLTLNVIAAQDSQHIAAVIARCGQKINAECSLELQAACRWPAAVVTSYNNTPRACPCSMPPLSAAPFSVGGPTMVQCDCRSPDYSILNLDMFQNLLSVRKLEVVASSVDAHSGRPHRLQVGRFRGRTPLQATGNYSTNAGYETQVLARGETMLQLYYSRRAYTSSSVACRVRCHSLT